MSVPVVWQLTRHRRDSNIYQNNIRKLGRVENEIHIRQKLLVVIL